MAPKNSKVGIVISIGQSLSLGWQSTPIISPNQYGTGCQLGDNAENTTGTLKPLFNASKETPFKAAIDYIDRGYIHDYSSLLVVTTGVLGAGYADLKKGTVPFDKLKAQLTTAFNANFHEVEIIAIMCIHGETDAHTAVARDTYKQNLITWQKDISEMAQEIGFAPKTIPFLACQTSSFSWYVGVTSFSGAVNYASTGSAILELSKEYPDIFKFVCPKYMFNYADGVHLTSNSSKRLGQYYGRVITNLMAGKTWTGIRPKSAKLVDPKTIDIEFEVPVAPLVLNSATAEFTNPGAFGFRIMDGTTSKFINSVTILNPTTVRLTAQGFVAANATVDYAWSAANGAGGGPTTGARGLLSDSDLSANWNEAPGVMPNYCPHFKIPVIV